jgi:DNA-directed RNA polymerase specialized sigma24 family protein
MKLTDTAFNQFLACLDADRDRAGERYETIRRGLVRMFDARGAFDPATCADETLNRVIAKVGAGEIIRDLPTYCHGVARLVLLETLRAQQRHNVALDDLPPRNLAVPEVAEERHDEAQHRCLQHCLQKLPAANRHLILRYYQDERRAKINQRLALAAELDIPLNALRNRAQRIRAKLEECIHGCLRKK